MSEFNWFDYNVRTNCAMPNTPARCDLVIGDQYLMHVDGAKKVRVLLISEPVEERNELRAHVVVLQDNPYVKSGKECRPLAFTLEKLK